VTGVLLVPVGFTAIWMTVFGNTAINLQLAGITQEVSTAVADNIPVALFHFLEQFPLSSVSSLVAVILVVTFFVTSSDSGSLVIDTITAGGNEDTATWQRVFWAFTEGVVAAVLLVAGGLTALQTASIVSALPFTFVMLAVCWGLLRGLRMEGLRRLSMELPATVQIANAQVPWQRRLMTIISHPRREQVERFLETCVAPAFEEVAAEIRRRGWQAEIQANGREVAMTVFHGGEREFLYAVRARSYRAPTFAFPEFEKERGEQDRYWRAEVHLLEGSQHYDLMGYTKEQVIADVLSQYEKHMYFLHLSRPTAAE
jgi:choline/glycine/proline betaine transport protein